MELEKKKTVAVRINEPLDKMDCTRTTKIFAYTLSLSYHREFQYARSHHQDKPQRVRSLRAHAQARQSLCTSLSDPEGKLHLFLMNFYGRARQLQKLRCTIV